MTLPSAEPPKSSPATNSSLNLPNAITFLRLILSFVVLVLIDLGNYWISATVIFVIAVCTDYFDGYFARKWNQVTVLGRIMDPFVDKVIIGGTLIFLTPHENSGICPWVTFIVIGREMFITGLRSVLEGHGVDFSATWTGKIKMTVQSVTIPLAILSLSPSFADADWRLGPLSFIDLRNYLIYAMIAITIYSGVEYTWRGLRLMKQQAATPSDE